MKTLITLALSLTLLACTQSAGNPKAIADKYWQFLQSGNTAEAEKLISIASQGDFSAHTDRIGTISQLENGEARALVSTTITTINSTNNRSYSQTFDTVLVLQKGEWKVDVSQTPIPASPNARAEELQKLADELSRSMQENIDSVDETMSQGMQLLNEALREGSKEMGDSLLNMMNQLNDSMKDSIDQMKQRREQKPLKPQPQNKPDANDDEGMI